MSNKQNTPGQQFLLNMSFLLIRTKSMLTFEERHLIYMLTTFFLKMELFNWANFRPKVLASTDRRAGVCSLLSIKCILVTRRNRRL